MIREQVEFRGVRDSRVLAAMRKVPRHEFVPEQWVDAAYEDHPLPIGHDQTISQPYIVALMTELLHPGPGMKALEVGTGSGYQAAILAETGAEVWSMEILEPLANESASRLQRLGYRNVHVKRGDGYTGWPEQAPFDGIIVTAGATHVPPPLIEQLKPGGRMVIPVGEPHGEQALLLVEKGVGGRTSTREVTSVLFVPLIRGQGD
ncbi:MAG TPA: protein-L-isoaspartate(D-aspartate) O-methyltransferase [Verrucomicrobiae bacterium]|nr:protein-L-isoaspartate(D-aspartate) O-methyltransferase [Verrucomicrobiae bacterium]